MQYFCLNNQGYHTLAETFAHSITLSHQMRRDLARTWRTRNWRQTLNGLVISHRLNILSWFQFLRNDFLQGVVFKLTTLSKRDQTVSPIRLWKRRWCVSLRLTPLREMRFAWAEATAVLTLYTYFRVTQYLPPDRRRNGGVPSWREMETHPAAKVPLPSARHLMYRSSQRHGCAARVATLHIRWTIVQPCTSPTQTTTTPVTGRIQLSVRHGWLTVKLVHMPSYICVQRCTNCRRSFNRPIVVLTCNLLDYSQTSLIS